jgi:hypothetical protein
MTLADQCTIGDDVILHDVGVLYLHWELAPGGEARLQKFIARFVPQGWAPFVAATFNVGTHLGMASGNGQWRFAVRGKLPAKPGRHDIGELVTGMASALRARIEKHETAAPDGSSPRRRHTPRLHGAKQPLA